MNPFHEGFGPGSFISFGLFGLTVGLFGLILIALVIVLKGYSLWYAARRGEKGWFIALLLINTFGVLELVYLYFIVGKWNSKKEAGSSNSTSAPTPTA